MSYKPWAADLYDFDVMSSPWIKDKDRAEGETWRNLRRMNRRAAEQAADKIYGRLRSYIYEERNGVERKRPSKAKFNDDIGVLFDRKRADTFVALPTFNRLVREVHETGILILDTEGPDADTIKRIGCKQKNAQWSVYLCQFSSLFGTSIFVRPEHDCRDLHKCQCGHSPGRCPVEDKCRCDPDVYEECPMGMCPKRSSAMTELDHIQLSQTHGCLLPKEIIALLLDPAIIKVQSNITGSTTNPGDLEKLEEMLKIKIPSWVELQNLFAMRYPSRSNHCTVCTEDFFDEDEKELHDEQVHGGNRNAKSGISELARKFGLPAGDAELKVDGMASWRSPRHKPYTLWTARQKYYDALDVMLPAAFLLKLAVEVTKCEPSTGPYTSVMPYLRQVLLLFKNEPSHTVLRPDSPPGKYWPWKDTFVNFDGDSVLLSLDHNFPWHPACPVQGRTLRGPLVVRNLRQLSIALMDDAYRVTCDPTMVAEEFRPPPVDPVEKAKENHPFKNPVGRPRQEFFRYQQGGEGFSQPRLLTRTILTAKRARKHDPVPLTKLEKTCGPAAQTRPKRELVPTKTETSGPSFEDFRPRSARTIEPRNEAPSRGLMSPSDRKRRFEEADEHRGPVASGWTSRPSTSRQAESPIPSTSTATPSTTVDRSDGDHPPAKKKRKTKDYTTVETPNFYGRCYRCGLDVYFAYGHKIADCKEAVRCDYPVCTGNRNTHATLVCKDLHRVCIYCRRRGHAPEAHQQHDLVSLEVIFRLWQPFGVFTSLPLLANTNHWRSKEIEPEEYRFGVYNRSLNHGVADK